VNTPVRIGVVLTIDNDRGFEVGNAFVTGSADQAPQVVADLLDRLSAQFRTITGAEVVARMTEA
jgi:6-phosphofructokinase